LGTNKDFVVKKGLVVTEDIELGHATDTTLSRSSGGVLAVEGVVVPTISSTNTLTNKTLTSPVLSGLIATTLTSGSEQVLISDTSDTALFKVVQLGTGNAFEVHDQASDTSAFVAKNNGKVGILKNPASSLTYDVEIGGETLSERFTSSVSGSVGSPAFRFSSDSNNGMYLGGTDILGFSTAGTERMTISAAGVVNIAGSLTVAGSAVGGIASLVADTSPQLGGDLDVQARYITTSTTDGDVKFKENGAGGFIFYDDDESEYLAIREGGHIQFSLNTAGGSSEQIMQYRDAGGSFRNFMSINSDDLYIHNRAANGRVIIQANTSTAGANDVTAATFEDDKVTFAVQPVLPSSGIKFSDGSEQTVAASGADATRLPAFKTLLSSNDDKLHMMQYGHMGQVAVNTAQNKYAVFQPFHSGPGGTFTKISCQCNTGVVGAAAGLTVWSEDSNNKPTTKVAGEFEFDFSSSGIVTLTGQSIVLTANTRYWVSWRQHPDASAVPNFYTYEVAMETIAGGDQNIPFCNVLFYLSTSAFGSTLSHGSFTSTYRQWCPKMWLEIA